MQQSYTPSDKILEKYAELIVQFGLRDKNDEKPKPGSVVHYLVPEVAKPLYFHLQKAILKNGYHPLGQFFPSSDSQYKFQKDFYKIASEDQLTFSPEKLNKALIDQIDCTILVLAQTDHHELNQINTQKIFTHNKARSGSISYKRKKIDAGKLNWTIVLYGTDAGAKEANLTGRQYWNQIIKACYLDEKDPIKIWQKIDSTVQKTANKLTKMEIEALHMSGEDVDLTVGIGHNRFWRAGGGNNIPSYEVFTSPNWRETKGWIRFNQPFYSNGKKIEGIQLWFENGKVIKSKASKNYDVLKSMLAIEGGNRLGEFSLTDSRLSRITKFMAETLYDENMGGKYGNSHVAIGASFRDCYLGEIDPKWKNSDWDKLGFNNSIVHSDFVTTTNRTVTATLKNGKNKVIYQNGQFTI